MLRIFYHYFFKLAYLAVLGLGWGSWTFAVLGGPVVEACGLCLSLMGLFAPRLVGS